MLVFLIAGVGHWRERLTAKEARIRAEWLDPYLAYLAKGTAESAWERLTTEGYRERHEKSDFVGNNQLVRERFGGIVSVEFIRAKPTWESLHDRRFEAVLTKWVWSKGLELNRTFELVDVPGVGYRLDGTKVGGRGGQVVPEEVPDGPW